MSLTLSASLWTPGSYPVARTLSRGCSGLSAFLGMLVENWKRRWVGIQGRGSFAVLGSEEAELAAHRSPLYPQRKPFSEASWALQPFLDA